MTVNLAKMPHLLVAGTTGSGKSVTVNGMITSILYNATPEEVRFIMVDPKMLELSIYEGIPHLLLPVVTDPKKANLALRWAVDEMERRYELLAKTGVRDISSYNAKVESSWRRDGQSAADARRRGATAARQAAEGGDRRRRRRRAGDGAGRRHRPADRRHRAPSPRRCARRSPPRRPPPRPARGGGGRHGRALRKLPFIVIVIDEFADLMMVAPKDVETSVARLAQKARAAGSAPHPGHPAALGRRHHRPHQGQLPQPGGPAGGLQDRLPHHPGPAGGRDPAGQRRHVVLRPGDQAAPDPRGVPLRRRGPPGGGLPQGPGQAGLRHGHPQAARRGGRGRRGAPVDDFHDALYDQAVAIVCETRQASVSFIQRRLQIGYNRSARMVEQMERDGIVGPANGIKPREVLAPAGEYLDQRQS